MREGLPQQVFRTGDCTVYPLEDRIERGGQSVHVEPRTMAVLEMLARRPGEVVSAEEILARIWRGRVVTDNTLYRSISLVRKALGDDPENPRYVQTIPRKGYRLVTSVAWNPGGTAHRLGGTKALASGLMIAVAAALVGIFFLGAQTDSAQSEVTVAVLPLRDIGLQGDLAYLTDGIAGDVIAALSRVPGLRVTSRDSSFRFRPERAELDAREIGDSLGVSHLVYGSVAKDSDQLRIQVRLDDTRTGMPLLRRQLIAADNELPRIGGDIAKILAGSLGLDTGKIRHARTGWHQPQAEAYEHYLQARFFMEGRSPEALHEARDQLQQATVLDPRFAEAYASLAEATLLHAVYTGGMYGNPEMPNAIAVAEAAVSRALDLDEGLAVVHRALGILRRFQEKIPAAEQAYREALALDPNDTQTLIWLGQLLNTYGRNSVGRPYLEKAVELDPLSLLPRRHLALSYFFEDPWKSADLLQEIRVDYPDDHLTLLQLTRLLDEQGRLDESLVTLTAAADTTSDPATLGMIFQRLVQDWAVLGQPNQAVHWWTIAQAGNYEHRFLQPAWVEALLRNGRTDEAMEVLDRWLASDPTETWRLAVASTDRLLAGDVSGGTELLEQLVREPAEDELGNLLYEMSVWSGYLPAVDYAWVLRKDGRNDEVAAVLAVIEEYVRWYLEVESSRYGPRYVMACARAAGGDAGGALAWLEKAVERGFVDPWRLKNEPWWDLLRDDARFLAIEADVELKNSEMRAAALAAVPVRID